MTKTPEQIAMTIHERFASTASSATGERITAMIVAAIEADRAERGPELAVLARGEVFTNDERVEVLDLDHVLGMTKRSEYDADDIAKIEAKLRGHGWESIADDVVEAWEDAEA
jgi:hypothetical protein